jgi:hypothetical protein
MLKYITSLILALLTFTANAQENEELTISNDSIVYKKNFGLRIGADISKPIIASRDANYSGFELVADYRIKKDLYIAGEIGIVDKTSEEDNYNFTTKGSYITAGINVNAFKNWLEMDNELYYGLRYGFSTFSQTLNEYTVFQEGSTTLDGTSAYFDPKTETPNEEFSGLTAHWMSLVFGMKVETFKNLYLGLSMNISKLIGTTDPNNFKTLYIPGFNKVYATDSSVSFNYTISYRIPLYKK